jgi:hypothetical protein
MGFLSHHRNSINASRYYGGDFTAIIIIDVSIIIIVHYRLLKTTYRNIFYHCLAIIDYST